jgi:hypothetical protein
MRDWRYRPLGNLCESAHKSAFEFAFHFLKDFECLCRLHGLLVRSAFDQRCIDIANRHEAYQIIDLRAGEAVRISAPIEQLVMPKHDFEWLGLVVVLSAQEFIANSGMRAHDCSFFACQSSRLVQDGKRDFRLAEIVQQGRPCDVFLIAPCKLQAG